MVFKTGIALALIHTWSVADGRGDSSPSTPVVASMSASDSGGGRPPVLKEVQAGGPYCGIYSLLACLKAVGIEIDIEHLWKAEYVGSARGSSAAELVRAAEAAGANALPLKNLTHRDLARATTPMLLHMRSNWSNADYNHWVAFLGFEGDRVRILDPPHPTHTLSRAELLAGWDGLAVAISHQEHDAALVNGARRDLALTVVAAGAVLLLVRPSLVRRGAADVLA